MSDFFNSKSAIERAVGMPEKQWLRFFDNEREGERTATTQGLTNLTEREREQRDKLAREANLERLSALADAGMPLFEFGEVNQAEIGSESNERPFDDFDTSLQCEDVYVDEWREFETIEQHESRISENLSACL